jgi:hypothetical protein
MFKLFSKEKPFWAGVYGRNQHEAGRVGDGRDGAGGGHVSVFQRLTQHFQHVFAEFGQLVNGGPSALDSCSFFAFTTFPYSLYCSLITPPSSPNSGTG